MATSETLYDKYPWLKKPEELGDAFYETNESNDGREFGVLEYIYNHPSLAELRGQPSKILDAIDEYSSEKDFLISIGPDKSRVLKELLVATPPKVLVELGGYLGYSAILFADTIRAALPPGTPFQVLSLEASPVFASIAMNLISLAGLSDHIKVITGKAEESLRRLKAEGALEHIDLLFLDHVEKLYHIDLQLVESLGLLKPGSYIWADNVVRPGAPEYRAYVRSHPKLESKGVKGLIMPGAFGDEIEVSKVLE
ncbi:S-adenosyl-L-methionine-dependent methyltransferase [Thozetella sp. PMI_491]|nr:S-adenosyl-L-methionine-dependent methyltransferase [Thozetella sp. PMI_491]